MHSPSMFLCCLHTDIQLCIKRPLLPQIPTLGAQGPRTEDLQGKPCVNLEMGNFAAQSAMCHMYWSHGDKEIKFKIVSGGGNILWAKGHTGK